MRAFRPELDFTSSPTLCDFVTYWPELQTERAVLGVFGPVGSGKSTACCAKLMMIGMMQPPDPRDNIRRARLGIVRNTTPMLRSTTIATWKNIFPEESCGRIVYSAPITQRIKVKPGPNGEPGIDFEIMFLALDNEKDLGKLKSLEWTAVYINEADLVHPAIFRYARRRLGRYPAKRGDYQAIYPLVIMDCNSVDEDHQLAQWYENPPEEWKFWKQPMAVLEVKQVSVRRFQVVEDDPRYKGRMINASRSYEAANRKWILNPDAENLAHLQDGYYETQLAGSKLSEIQRDLQVKFVFNEAGKPVIPDYADDFHSSEFSILEDVPIQLASDVGGGTLNPAGLVMQKHPRGIILVHDELAAADVGVERFNKEMSKLLNREHFRKAPIPKNGRGLPLHTDPSGKKGDELFNVAVLDHLTAYGWDVKPAWTNDIEMRIEAITNCATRIVTGRPGLLVHKRCKILRKALAGKWQYRRLKISGTDDRYHSEPDKNHPFSDVGDALGYGCMGMGEARNFQRPGRQQGQAPGQATQAKVNFDVYSNPGGVQTAKTDFDPYA